MYAVHVPLLCSSTGWDYASVQTAGAAVAVEGAARAGAAGPKTSSFCWYNTRIASRTPRTHPRNSSNLFFFHLCLLVVAVAPTKLSTTATDLPLPCLACSGSLTTLLHR